MSLQTLQWCYLCNYQIRMKKSRVFYGYGHSQHGMQEHQVPGIHNYSFYCSSASNHSKDEGNVGITPASI